MVLLPKAAAAPGVFRDQVFLANYGLSSTVASAKPLAYFTATRVDSGRDRAYSRKTSIAVAGEIRSIFLYTSTISNGTPEEIVKGKLDNIAAVAAAEPKWHVFATVGSG